MAQTLFSSKNERMNKENCNKHKKEMESSYSSQYGFLNWSTTRRAKALKVGRRESCSSTNCFYAQYLHSSLYKMQNVYKGSTNKNWYFQEYFLSQCPPSSVHLGIQMSLLAKKVGFSRPKTMATKISHKV